MNRRIVSNHWNFLPGKAWGLQVCLVLQDGTRLEQALTLEPVVPVSVVREEYPSMPLFELDGGWNARGICPECLKAQVSPWCAGLHNAIILDSVKVETERGDLLRFGLDFTATPEWAVIGRLPSGRIRPDDKVRLSYSYLPPRLDNLVLAPDNTIRQVLGESGTSTPLPPQLGEGDELIGRIYFFDKKFSLADDMLFPLVEENFNGYPLAGSAEQFLPRTMQKLRNGETLRILAWGDSVTESLYMPDVQKWQVLFLSALKKKYPQANIELATRAWGGHRSIDFLTAPKGDIHNFEEQVLAVEADLIVSEFVNDCSLEDEILFRNVYQRILADFRTRGREWILCTPHLIRAVWMGLPGEKCFEEEPRKFVQYLRNFSAEHHLALADASRRWCHLWKEALPHNSLLTNAINDPDERGMEIYAESLMALFP